MTSPQIDIRNLTTVIDGDSIVHAGLPHGDVDRLLVQMEAHPCRGCCGLGIHWSKLELWLLRLFVWLASDPLQFVLVVTFAEDELVGVVRKAILDTELDLYLLLLKSGGIGWLLISRG